MSSLTKAQLAQLLATQNTTSNDPVIIEADQFIGDLIGTANVAKRLEKSYRLSINGDAVGSCLLNADDTLLTLQVTHADQASLATTATNANNAARASLADLANLASFAIKSRLATLANKATEATHATSSDTALSAEHATTATNASHATNADSATSAISATNATNAAHAVSADTATTATSALSATYANHAINADHATVADLANVASALNFTIIKVVTAYPQTLDANALYVLVDENSAIIGIKTKDKTAVDFDIMTVDVLSAISESTDLKDGKLYAVPGEDGTGTKLDPKSASVVFKRKVQGIDVYYQVSGGGVSVVLPEASTTKKGIVQLTNAISQDETKAVTPKAIDDLQDTTFVTMSTAQYVYATKDELTNKSLSTAQYIDNVAHSLSSAIYQESQRVDNRFVTLSTAQYISGLKEFINSLPQSSLTPSNDNDFATKKYVDEHSGSGKIIGESVFSLIPLSDAGLHLYDGALISGSGSYAEFVSYIEELYTNHPTWNCWISESDWQTCVTTYGACGKFVVDTTNHTVRLPKVTGIVEGTIDANALGDLVEAGLPNITAAAYMVQTNTSPTVSGAFSIGSTSTANINGGNSGTLAQLLLNAKTQNTIYKNNFNKVQPQTIKGYYYIVLANVTKTEIQVDIDNVLTDLNGKADKDLSNSVSLWSNSAKIAMAHMAMPSNKNDDLILGTSGAEYTAPADGYVYINKASTAANQYIDLQNKSGSNCSTCYATNASQPLRTTIAISKGQIFTINYNAAGTTNAFKFIYANGSESEQA